MKARALGMLFILLIVRPGWSPAEEQPGAARAYFNRGAERYTRQADEEAKKEVREGLQQFPEDSALLALKALLEQPPQSSPSQQNQEQKQDQQQQQQPQNAPQKGQEKQEQDQQPSSQTDKSQQAPKEKDDQKDEAMEAREMTKEEAALLLDAMKQQEEALRRKIAMDRLRSSMDRLPPVEKDW